MPQFNWQYWVGSVTNYLFLAPIVMGSWRLLIVFGIATLGLVTAAQRQSGGHPVVIIMMAHNGVEFSYNLKAPNKTIQVGAEPLPLSSIPANIRHKFGDSDCERLLSDPHLVSSTWHRTQRSAKRYKNPHVYYQDRPVNSPASVKSEEQPYGTVLLRNTYQDMSRIARNAFPGESLTDETKTFFMILLRSYFRAICKPKSWKIG